MRSEWFSLRLRFSMLISCIVKRHVCNMSRSDGQMHDNASSEMESSGLLTLMSCSQINGRRSSLASGSRLAENARNAVHTHVRSARSNAAHLQPLLLLHAQQRPAHHQQLTALAHQPATASIGDGNVGARNWYTCKCGLLCRRKAVPLPPPRPPQSAALAHQPAVTSKSRLGSGVGGFADL